MTNNEAIDTIKCLAWHSRPDEEDIEQAIKTLEQEPCEDTISRQAAIEVAKQYWYKPDIAGALAELPSVQPEPQWIPVSERLPEVGKDVMICYDFKGHRSVLIGVLYGDEKFHGYDDEYLTPEGRKYRKAVAWMPLPEPYRERRTDG